MTVLEQRYIGGDRKRGPIEAAARVRQGFTRADLAKLFAARGYTRGAEIGVADGRNSLTLCQNIPGLHLLCVDPWRKYADNHRGGPQSQHDFNLATIVERLAGYHYTLRNAFSMEAVVEVPPESLDFVYIDAHHGFDYVMEDVIAWSRRVRPGGIVAGHDYYEFQGAGVVEAVNAYTHAHGITDWWITDEKEPSFFWVKP